MNLWEVIKDYIRYDPINYALCGIIFIIIFLEFWIWVGYQIITISFILTPILTIIFIILWDGYNSKKKEDALFLNLELEISVNIHVLDENTRLILFALRHYEEKIPLAPYKLLKSEIWELLRFNTPKILFRNNLIGEIADYYFQVSRINETIDSRNNYKIYNSAMNTYISELRLYDEDIYKLNIILIDSLEKNIFNSINLNKRFEDVQENKKHLNTVKKRNAKIKELLSQSNEDKGDK